MRSLLLLSCIIILNCLPVVSSVADSALETVAIEYIIQLNMENPDAFRFNSNDIDNTIEYFRAIIRVECDIPVTDIIPDILVIKRIEQEIENIKNAYEAVDRSA